jgi:hypothetical protein
MEGKSDAWKNSQPISYKVDSGIRAADNERSRPNGGGFFVVAAIGCGSLTHNVAGDDKHVHR